MYYQMKLIALFTSLAIACSVGAVNPYSEPLHTSPADTAGWKHITDPISLGWVSADSHIPQFTAPKATTIRTDTTIHAWRGERIGLEALVVATMPFENISVTLSPLKTANGKKTEAPGSYAAFMRYVLTTAYNTCGYPSDTLPTFTVPDMIDHPTTRLNIEPRSVRPVWVSIEIPRSINPGSYTATLTLSGTKNKSLATINLNICIDSQTLPEPNNYAFYLDLWQQPYAISRYYGVEPWSKEHFRLLEPYTKMLARAGAKTISTILFYEPWGEQSHDKFEPMVQTTLLPDSTWHYDYSILDSYIEHMQAAGIDGDIECFTMIPWDMQFRYFDQAAGEYRFLSAKTSSPEYSALWTPFLQSLAAHMRQKGWFDRTVIMIDERGLSDIINARQVASNAVPGIRMALAGNYHPELADSLSVYTLLIGDPFPPETLQSRHNASLKTLIYTCCANSEPNIFSNNSPADAAYIPLYATATGHDGYLHWSFTNWTDNPLTDTRFRMFAPGDTYFVYPDGRSSVRYERLLEGIQLSEKVRLRRNQLININDAAGLDALNRALLPITTGSRSANATTGQAVNHLHNYFKTTSK